MVATSAPERSFRHVRAGWRARRTTRHRTSVLSYTGSRLKRLGVGYLRTDHAGKNVNKGQRGTSAKRDDVDVIWSMTQTKGGATLKSSSRLSWVGNDLAVERHKSRNGVSYSAQIRIGWPDGTKELVAALDALGVATDAGRPTVRQAMTAAESKGPTELVQQSSGPQEALRPSSVLRSVLEALSRRICDNILGPSALVPEQGKASRSPRSSQVIDSPRAVSAPEVATARPYALSTPITAGITRGM